MPIPRVLIAGGGFGGLQAVRALKSARVNVTLIDKRNYHLFRPMLYQVATGLLSADQISGPLRSILSHQKNVEVLMDEVTGINPHERTVQLGQRDPVCGDLPARARCRPEFGTGHQPQPAMSPPGLLLCGIERRL